jgi:hypothetical protein
MYKLLCWIFKMTVIELININNGNILLYFSTACAMMMANRHWAANISSARGRRKRLIAGRRFFCPPR